MEWDYFVSHASEDKLLVVAPLAHYFRSVGFSVWYDDFSLQVGDSILGSIDRGLAGSAFGIVVLSPSFFAKAWPQRELAALIATSTDGQKRVLPIWHEIDGLEIAKKSPVLADVKAVSTKRGLHVVAEHLIRASFPERVHSLPMSNDAYGSRVALSEAQATLRGLLSAGASRDDVFLILSAYQELLGRLDRYAPPLIFPASRIHTNIPFDFAVIAPHGVTGPISLTFVILGSTVDNDAARDLLQHVDETLGSPVTFDSRPANNYLPGRLAGEFPVVLEAADQLSRLVSTGNIHHDRPGVWNFSLLLVHGRRDGGSGSRDDNALRSATRAHLETASYDRLVD